MVGSKAGIKARSAIFEARGLKFWQDTPSSLAFGPFKFRLDLSKLTFDRFFMDLFSR